MPLTAVAEVTWLSVTKPRRDHHRRPDFTPYASNHRLPSRFWPRFAGAVDGAVVTWRVSRPDRDVPPIDLEYVVGSGGPATLVG